MKFNIGLIGAISLVIALGALLLLLVKNSLLQLYYPTREDLSLGFSIFALVFSIAALIYIKRNPK